MVSHQGRHVRCRHTRARDSRGGLIRRVPRRGDVGSRRKEVNAGAPVGIRRTRIIDITRRYDARQGQNINPCSRQRLGSPPRLNRCEKRLTWHRDKLLGSRGKSHRYCSRQPRQSECLGQLPIAPLDPTPYSFLLQARARRRWAGIQWRDIVRECTGSQQ